MSITLSGEVGGRPAPPPAPISAAGLPDPAAAQIRGKVRSGGGGNASNCMLLAAFLVMPLVGCDKFWHLSNTAVVPTPVHLECTHETLADLDGVDSVWVRSSPGDAADPASTSFVVWSEERYGRLLAVERGDSIVLQLSHTWASGWIGGKPNQDSVEAVSNRHSDVIRRIARACWGSSANVVVNWPE